MRNTEYVRTFEFLYEEVLAYSIPPRDYNVQSGSEE
jgi:hypothetical protein